MVGHTAAPRSGMQPDRTHARVLLPPGVSVYRLRGQ